MKYRNHVAQNPLLRKGGAHQKSRSSQRSTNRRKLNSYLDEWYEDEHNEKSDNKGIKEEQDSSSFFAIYLANSSYDSYIKNLLIS